MKSDENCTHEEFLTKFDKHEKELHNHFSQIIKKKTAEIEDEEKALCDKFNTEKDSLLEQQKIACETLNKDFNSKCDELLERMTLSDKPVNSHNNRPKDYVISILVSIVAYGVIFLCMLIVYGRENNYMALLASVSLGFGMVLSFIISWISHHCSCFIARKKHPGLKINLDLKCYEYIGFSMSLLVILLIAISQCKDIVDVINSLVKSDTLIFEYNALLIFLTVAFYIIFSLFIPAITNKARKLSIVEYVFFCIPIFNFEAYLSMRFKNSIENTLPSSNRIFKGAIVRFTNLINLVFSSILSILFLCFSLPFYETDQNLILLWIAFACVIFARAIGRSLEIIHAFFRDVMDKNKKTTDIDSSERVKLAITSLIEITFLFAPIYLVYNHLFYNNMKFSHNISALFYSFGITTYRTIDFNIAGRTVAIVMMLQVITSMVLVLFTFARYIGEIKVDKY